MKLGVLWHFSTSLLRRLTESRAHCLFCTGCAPSLRDSPAAPVPPLPAAPEVGSEIRTRPLGTFPTLRMLITDYQTMPSHSQIHLVSSNILFSSGLWPLETLWAAHFVFSSHLWFFTPASPDLSDGAPLQPFNCTLLIYICHN